MLFATLLFTATKKLLNVLGNHCLDLKNRTVRKTTFHQIIILIDTARYEILICSAAQMLKKSFNATSIENNL